MSKKTYCYFNILVIRLVLNLMQINFAHIIQKEKNYILNPYNIKISLDSIRVCINNWES